MRPEQDAMMLVRAELCERLDALRRLSGRRGASDGAEAAAGLRQVAAAYGLTPVVRLAEAVERAMRRPEYGGPGQCALYLERLNDAIGCERLDEEASQAIMASVSVRFA